MTQQQMQAAQQSGQQALNGIDNGQNALQNGQFPQAQQSFNQAAQGLSEQEQTFRDAARNSAIQSPAGQGGQRQAGTPGSGGMRSGMNWAHSTHRPGKVTAKQDWDKFGNSLDNQSRQVRGYNIPPYFRERIKAYFNRIAQERKKRRD